MKRYKIFSFICCFCLLLSLLNLFSDTVNADVADEFDTELSSVTDIQTIIDNYSNFENLDKSSYVGDGVWESYLVPLNFLSDNFALDNRGSLHIPIRCKIINDSVEILSDFSDESNYGLFEQMKSVSQHNTICVCFVNSKMFFVRFIIDDSKKQITINKVSSLGDIRYVCLAYLGIHDSQWYKIVSEEVGTTDYFHIGSLLNNILPEYKSDIFLPDLTYQVQEEDYSDNEELLRLKLRKCSEIFDTSDISNADDSNMFYVYDSDYSCFEDAKNAGAVCYSIYDGDYDAMLLCGDYKVDALVDDKLINLGIIQSTDRSIDISDLRSNFEEIPFIRVSNLNNTAIDIDYGYDMQSVDLKKFVSNINEVGGIKYVSLSYDSCLYSGLRFDNGCIWGKVDNNSLSYNDSERRVNFIFMAGNGTKTSARVTFIMHKSNYPYEVFAKVDESTITVGGLLPDIIPVDSDGSKIDGDIRWCGGSETRVKEGSNTFDWLYSPSSDFYNDVRGNYTFYAYKDGIVSTTEISTSLTTFSETQTTAEHSVLYGDANLDSSVDISDAVLLNKATAGSVQLNEQQKNNSDCDADGDISTNDSVALLRFLVHLVDTLPSKD